MGTLEDFGIENCAWRLCEYCWFFLCDLLGQNYPVLPTRILFSSIAYCTRRGLTKKSNHGGGKEKSLSYLRVLINHIFEQIKSEKQTCRQTVSHIKLYKKKIRQTDRQFDIENYTCIIFYAKLSICLFVCLSDFFNVSFSMTNSQTKFIG